MVSVEFNHVEDPFLRKEVSKLYFWSRFVFWANIICNLIPSIPLSFFRDYVIVNWIRFGTAFLGLLFSMVVFVMSRPHPQLKSFINIVHLFTATVLVFELVFFIPFWVLYGEGWNDLIPMIFLMIVPIAMVLIHSFFLSIQCANAWKYAGNVAAGRIQWNYSKNVGNTNNYPQQNMHQQPAPGQGVPPQPYNNTRNV